MFAGLFTLALAATSALGATHTVLVGQNKTKTFTPSELTAAVGDTVEFSFVGGNHTATQSTFASPCTNAGFKSGFVPGNETSPTSFSIIVNDTKPVWVYCAQTGHCAAGMVFAINAPATGNTFAAFQAAATGGGNATTSSNTTTGSGSGSSGSGTSSGASSAATASAGSGPGSGSASTAEVGSGSAAAGESAGASSTGTTSSDSANSSSAGSAGALSAVVPGLAGILAIAAASFGVLL
ncbi:hypothetical protein IAT38_006231 [Cryptococcus sp. DSM 104549]